MRYRIGLAAAALVLAWSTGPGAWAADVPTRRDPLKELEAAPGQAGHDIRVQITARTTTTIGADMAGRLVKFPLRDGDRFKQGQVLARFDCGLADGNLARARATLDKKKAVLDTNKRLRQLGSNSGLELEVAAAEAREAAAEVTVAEAMAARCTIAAPFSGRVAGVMAHEYQQVAEGAPLLDILDDRDLELELIVPSRWLAWLKSGTAFTVTIDETGHTYKAELTRLSGRVDAVSQSIKVYGRIDSPVPDLLPGMSGKAQFALP